MLANVGGNKIIMKKIVKYCVYLLIYLDRFLLMINPWATANRVLLTYLSLKERKNALVRMLIVAVIVSMFFSLLWAIIVTTIVGAYIITHLVKNRIKNKAKL